MTWIKPPKLVVGDVVEVIAPSDAVEKKYLFNGVRLLESWGLRVKFSKHIYENEYGFAAGSPAHRWSDLVDAVNDHGVKAIWASNGGYAATQLWPLMVEEFFKKIKKEPKWFVGYSDICTILNALMANKVVSIHGPNLSGLPYWDIESQEWVRKMLFGEVNKGTTMAWDWKAIVLGKAVGRLLVSNLDTLITGFGTRFDPLENGGDDLILGIEEYFQFKSHIQRQIDMVINHRKAKRIKGIIVGRFSNFLRDKGYRDWEKHNSILKIIKDRISTVSNIPIVSLSDFGHPVKGGWLREHFPLLGKPETFLGLPNGVRALLNVSKDKIYLKTLEPICS